MESYTPKSSPLIREMDEQSRPREKALHSGFKSLTDAELLAIIFSTGVRGKSVIELSREMLADNSGHLSRLASLTATEICRRYKGIGQAKAITLLAALELGARSAADAARAENPVISGPDAAYTIMYPHMARLPHEEFWVLYLNRGLNILRESKIGQGGTGSTVVDVKIIMQGAVETLADSIMLFHNHPSGTLRPSQQDVDLTDRVRRACDIFNIALRDHLIITDGGYYSFHAHGLL